MPSFRGASISDMADAAIVQTDFGPVRGIVTDEYRLFQGIPYASSTGGGQRWRSPGPVQAWSEPRDATKPGNICASNRLCTPTWRVSRRTVCSSTSRLPGGPARIGRGR